MDNSTRIAGEEESRGGVKFRVHRYATKRMVTRGVLSPDGMNTQYIVEPNSITQLEININGAGVLLEPGALQYMHGSINSEVVRHEENKGFIARAISSAGTGESGHATRMTGTGTIWCEPSNKHFVIATMDGPEDALLIDDKAFYACSDTISMRTHRHTNISGALSGNGLMQPKLSGSGVFAVESPVPVDEIEAIELQHGQELVVDGDYMLMYSASLDVSIGTLVKGLRNALRSGEGFVYKFKGQGMVWVMPTAKFPG